MIDANPLLRSLFDAAVAAADPMRFMADHLPERPAGRTVVIGAGKASARMAEAVAAEWPDAEGLVLTRYGYERPAGRIEIASGAHPVPDAAGAEATARILALAEGLGPDDLALVLISGGASSLFTAPRPPLTLAEMTEVNAQLLASGLPIGAMNLARRQIDAAKGGRLAAAIHPARCLALAISDVPGDDPALIGSGPTVGGAADAATLAALAERLPDLPPAARHLLLSEPFALAANDPRLAQAETRVVAAPAQSLAAARALAEAAGIAVRDLGPDVEGEAAEIARRHARLALEATGPTLLLSGGELTVTRGATTGSGGPNAEYALALAIALDGAPGIHAIAGDTDGVDGAAEIAGAAIGPDTLAKARAAGRDPAAALADHDAHGFFAAIGNGVVTGPTLTNVNDFRAILIEAP